jgi:hypothetical protein
MPSNKKDIDIKSVVGFAVPQKSVVFDDVNDVWRMYEYELLAAYKMYRIDGSLTNTWLG